LTDSDKPTSLEFDVASEKKPQSFTHAEMITCDACLRANPPTRGRCLYCGVDLRVVPGDHDLQPTGEVKESTAESTAGPTPNVGDGYLVALAPGQTNIPSESSLAAIEALLNLTTTELRGLFDRGRSVPVTRAATPEQAAGLTEKLQALGIKAYWFRDDLLDPNVSLERVRALEFTDEGFVAIPAGPASPASGGRIATRWDDLLLMVAGRLLVNRVEVEERRRRGRAQPLGTRELFSDESVLDLYTKTNDSGWRMSSSSFDFSCLGPAKAMTAFENFTALRNLLRSRAPNAELDDSYVSLRPVLENVWPLASQTRKGEWRRSGAGKVDVATVTTTDNEAQFNCYSRLCHRLKLRALEGRE
jgi:hypothetical protein